MTRFPIILSSLLIAVLGVALAVHGSHAVAASSGVSPASHWAPNSSNPLAATPAEVISETAVSRVSERGATRADDRFSEAAMEDRKREGYF